MVILCRCGPSVHAQFQCHMHTHTFPDPHKYVHVRACTHKCTHMHAHTYKWRIYHAHRVENQFSDDRYICLHSRATVTKLPDAKPLTLVGCFSPPAKKELKWQFSTCWDSSLLCCQICSTSYQNSSFRSAHRHGSIGVFSVGKKTASSILSPLAGCIFMCLKPVKDVTVTR